MPVSQLRLFVAVIFAAFCLFCVGKIEAHEGWGIVVDRQGQVYFSDIPTNTIWKIIVEGKLEAAATNQHSHSLIKGDDGNIYGAHENGSVWRVTPDSGFTEVLPPNGDFPLSLHSFIIDRDGSIYSMNSGSVQSGQVKILKKAPDAEVTTLAGNTRGYADGRGSEAKFTSIDGMDWAADGSLYVTDGTYVRRVAMDGLVTTVGGGELTSESWGEDLMGLTVVPRNEILVADYSNRRILKIMPDGSVQTVLETGLIWSPTGVALVGDVLYVLEHLRMPLVLLGNIEIGAYIRVRKISPDGAATTLATVWGRNTPVFIVVLFVVIAILVLARRFRKRRKNRRICAAI
jgi:sugar lactone lactonase YvrE